MSKSIDVRNKAYHEIAESLSHKRKQVYTAMLSMYPCTNSEISKKLGIPINEVTGRTHELRKLFLIKAVDVTRGSMSRDHVLWAPVENNAERLKLVREELQRQKRILTDYQNMQSWAFGYCEEVRHEISKSITRATRLIKELTEILEK